MTVGLGQCSSCIKAGASLHSLIHSFQLHPTESKVNFKDFSLSSSLSYISSSCGLSPHIPLSIIFWSPENAYWGRGKDADRGERKRFRLSRDVSEAMGSVGSCLGLQFLLCSLEGKEMPVGSW